MSGKILISSVFMVCALGVAAAIGQEVRNTDNLPQTPEIATPPQNQTGQATETTVTPDAQVPEEFAPDLPPDDVVPEPQVKKQTLKDAGYDGSYDGDVYWQNSPEDQQIIAATPHRKREIEPAKKTKLMELARIMGSLHALRVSCMGAGDQTYRSKMATMLDLEAPSAEYIRDPLIVAFNSGFESLGQGQNPCPNDKDARETSYAKQGRAIAVQMAQIYRTAAETHAQPKF